MTFATRGAKNAFTFPTTALNVKTETLTEKIMPLLMEAAPVNIGTEMTREKLKTVFCVIINALRALLLIPLYAPLVFLKTKGNCKKEKKNKKFWKKK
jgi:hypothetical protein